MATSETGITRRQFLGLTGGLMILIGLPGEVMEMAEGAAPAEEVNAWLLIAPDNSVTVFSGKVELGQGIRTSFAQMVAEELTVPVSSVEMIMGDTDSVPPDGGTYGSLSTRTVGRRIMAAAAKAREILTDMAAEKWGVKPQELVVRDGRIAVANDPSKSVTLGELTEGNPITRTAPGEPTLLSPSEHKVIGKPLPRVDGPAIVTGAEKFVGDLRPPGMLYGAVLFPPSFGARFVSMDAAQAQKIPGVVAVVRDEGFVGVVAQRQDIAEQARDMIKATWEETPHPTQATLYDDLRASASPDRTLVDDAIVPAALAGAARTFKQTYRTSFLAHAPIEPHVALVSVTGDGATVWVSAQTPFPHRDAVARALGINTSKVHVFVPRVGGAFGGKENPILAVMAARLSRAVERPVMLGLSRAEELTWDLFKPAALIDVRSGVDAAGKVVAWGADIYNCGPRGAEPPYEFPKHIRTLRCNSPLAQGSWRGLGGSANTLAIECHMDAMASELSVDPVEFRLRHLGDNPRLAKTVQAAADKYGWKPRRAPSGQGIGFACAVDSGSCVAEVVEIDLDRSSGVLRVRRVVAAMESGLIINRDGITNQVQGAITMGLGMVLREAVRYENGKILTDSFAAYGIPTIKDAPLIETVLVDNPIHPPEGAGEPPLFPVAAAAVNAFFDATGERVRQIPLSPETVLAALRA